jgi:GTPase
MRRQRFIGSARPAGATAGRPMVAIVGRPNVGKSTLFNKLARKQIAVVQDEPGVTRDRHYADCWALGREFVLIDTGGFDPFDADPRTAGIASQVKLALAECDVVVCVFDGTTELTAADREAVGLLRDAGKPVIYVANKADSQKAAHASMGIYELGMEELLPVSALHSRGLGDLEERIAELLPDADDEPEELEENLPRVAIVGRPNAGKSSMVNRLLGEERQLVDDRPGTTVDSVDTLVERDGHRLVLIDTAGIRRQRQVRKTGGTEALGVYQAIRALDRADVAVLMIDAAEGAGEQDAKIAGLAVDRGTALVIVLNKSDLVDGEDLKAGIDRTREILSFCPWAPLVTTSAVTGKGTKKLLERIDDAVAEHRKRVSTAEVNRFFSEVLERHPPPSFHNRPVRLYYATQARSRPPTFVVMANDADAVHFSYQRYVANQLRERFGFQGTPIRVKYRSKEKTKRPR